MNENLDNVGFLDCLQELVAYEPSIEWVAIVGLNGELIAGIGLENLPQLPDGKRIAHLDLETRQIATELGQSKIPRLMIEDGESRRVVISPIECKNALWC